jgi:hypothetical protein
MAGQAVEPEVIPPPVHQVGTETHLLLAQVKEIMVEVLLEQVVAVEEEVLVLLAAMVLVQAVATAAMEPHQLFQGLL